MSGGASCFLCALGDPFARFAVKSFKSFLTAKATKKFRKVRKEDLALLHHQRRMLL